MTEPRLVTPHGGDRLDDLRSALTALELASVLPVDERSIAVVREVIAALRTRLADHAEAEALSA